ncbi:hypothetical protein [Idiomarina sp.]|uniref:hypothetical protein n=1 Tax=Idiomarina sp. TaxID=1874361 RepID=UPI00262B0012|nr:hypothetical protein [Idiomarina sp.]
MSFTLHQKIVLLFGNMKTLTVILTLITVLLAGTFSSSTAHAMSMSGSVSASSTHQATSEHAVEQHDCCDDVEMKQQSSCDEESSFCQHCEQHCAGQIGLTNVFNFIESTPPSQSYSMSELSLWQRTERLIRPPKPTTV